MSVLNLFHSRPHHNDREVYLRNFIFGIEDSLVSTVGLLAGVAVADLTSREILTTGLVLIFVEGFSMGIGSFLTEETTEEMAGQKVKTKEAVKGGIVMLLSYCLAGILPLGPYMFLTGEIAVLFSVILSLIGLVALGLGTSMYYHHKHPWLRGLKMLVLGGSATLIGMLVGKLFHL